MRTRISKFEQNPLNPMISSRLLIPIVTLLLFAPLTGFLLVNAEIGTLLLDHMWLVVGVALVISSLAIAYRVSGGILVLSPVLLYVVESFILRFVGSVEMSVSTNLVSYPSLGLFAVGQFAFVGGAFICNTLARFRPTSEIPAFYARRETIGVGPPRERVSLALMLFVPGLMGILFLFGQYGIPLLSSDPQAVRFDLEATGYLVYTYSMFLPLAAIVAVREYLQSSVLSSRLRSLVIGCSVILLVTITGSRLLLGLVLLMMTTMYSFYKPLATLRKLMLIGVAVVVIFFLLVDVQRYGLTNPIIDLPSIGSDLLWRRLFIVEALNMNLVLDRFLDSSLAPLWGASLLPQTSTWVGPIARALWPSVDPLLVSLDRWVGAERYGINVYGQYPSGHPGLFAEFLMNFSWAGLILICAWGVFLQWLFIRAIRCKSSDNLIGSAFAFAYFALSSKSGFYTIVSSVFVSLVILNLFGLGSIARLAKHRIYKESFL